MLAASQAKVPRSEVITMMRVAEEVRSMHTQDGGVVLDITRGKMFSLNPVGSKIVELVRQGYSEPRIADEISRGFGVSREVAAADTREFLDALEKHHLIDSCSSNGSS